MSFTEGVRSAARAAIAGPRRWVLLSVLAILALGAYWLGNGRDAASDSFLTAVIERGAIRTSVAATGTIQAVLTVQVGSQVTGRVAELLADFNSVVSKGQVLARIDPANFDAQLERARADLADAIAGVRTAEAAVANQKANLEASRVETEDARRALARSRELDAEGVVSTRDLEVAQAAFDTGVARVRQGEAQVRSAEAALEQARARVDQARAAVKIAEVNLVYTVITSPVDGVVISRSVDVGQTVSASLQAPTLFTIANDLTKMQVVANVDEADIGLISPDARVTFTVDAFPGEMFRGALNQIRLNPQTEQNVVTYSVIVDVGNPDLKLRPGMTANTTFTIAETEDALRLPNAALRFWPDGIPREREARMIAEAAGSRGTGDANPGGIDGRESGTGPSEGAVAGEGHPSRTGAPAAQSGHPGGAGAAVAPGGVIRFPTGRRAAARPRVVWVLGVDGRPQPRVVQIGISDGSASEIAGGDLAEGEIVIIGRNVTAEGTTPAGASPFGGARGPMGGRGRR